MSQGISGAASAGGVEHSSWKAIVAAFTVAAGAVCIGGAAAIVAISRGASGVASLSLMAAVVLVGAIAAGLLLHRAEREEKKQSPESLLERQLSARYGVPVQRVAWH